MKKRLLQIVSVLFAPVFFYGQALSPKEIHDRAADQIAEVLFDSKAKPIRDRIKQFENAFDTKLHFKVDDQSLDKLGGLSEHLFKLFQTFTSPVNTNVKTITAEFSALDENVLSHIMAYKTYATSDLRSCVLPLVETDRLDSMVCINLAEGQLTSEDYNEVPESISGLISNATYSYEAIESKNANCQNAFGFSADAYAQHVINTRQNRANGWASIITSLSTELTVNYSHLSNTLSANTSTNSGSTSVNLNINPNFFVGKHVIILNSVLNDCTQKDLESRCRILFKTTGIHYFFLTKTINFYIPLDSFSIFKNAITQALLLSHPDKNFIVALYIKMEDASTSEASATMLVKQNGDWLSNADMSFANLNNGGTYKEATYFKFSNLFKNIPKPLILCYQVAKVNGLLSTVYFSKGAHVKGKEQVYYHVLRRDRAFDELDQLQERLKLLNAQNADVDSKGYNPMLAEEIERVREKIKVCFVKASLHPNLIDVEVNFKEVHLQYEVIIHAAALKYIGERYKNLYTSNLISSLTSSVIIPTDLLVGSCPTEDKSDVIADILGAASLILSPTGLDFVPDALLVSYFLDQEKPIEALKASANLFAPYVLTAAYKMVLNCAEAIKEMHLGSRLFREGNAVKAISADKANMATGFSLDPNAMGDLLPLIDANPGRVKDLLPITAEQARVGRNVEKLEPAKRIEFTKKCFDEPEFKQKCWSDPDEVLKWGGRFSVKQIDDFVSFATKQGDRPSVMLGKFDGGGSTSYVERAGNFNTYFDMGDKWNEALDLVKGDIEEMWKINRKFLDCQRAQGKDFYFSHDPMEATGYLLREVNYIKQQLAATNIIKINNNTWKVIW